MQELLPEIPLGSDGCPLPEAGSGPYYVKVLFSLVDRYGPELVRSMNHPTSSAGIVEAMHSRGYDRVAEMLLWNDKILTINKGDYLITLSERRELFLSGVSPETAAKGLAFGMSVRQILAAHEGISNPVSEGWL